MSSGLADAAPLIATGEVRHLRLRPARNAFVYRSWFLLLPMRTLRRAPHPALPRNRRAIVAFFDRDHGDGRDDSLAWMESLLAEAGVDDADGEVWLQCYPRVLGYAFKPVSLWYCHRADGSLAAVVVEVNNTFGERHCYLLREPGLAFGREARAAKVFHVSPFCSVSGDYRFRFMRTDLHPAATAARRPPRVMVRIDHHDAVGALLRTSLSGTLAPLTASALRGAFLAMPMLTIGIVARIHWQALRLWVRRVPFIAKPVPPSEFVTRQNPR